MCLAILMTVSLTEILIFTEENKTYNTNKFVFKIHFIYWH